MPRWIPRILNVLAWLSLVPMLGLCLTQWFGIEGRRTITAFQALTPWVLVWAAPIALAASLCRRHPLALAALVPLFTLLALSAPIVFHGRPPSAAAGSPSLTVAYANVLFSNATNDEAAATLLATDADVLVIVEFATPFHVAMVAAVPDGDYPYRVEEINAGSSSIGVWSRRPIVTGAVRDISSRHSIDLILDVDGSKVHLLAVHPYPPTHDAVGWSEQLTAIGEVAAASTMPTMVVGDFNGSRWHPSYRALLARGFTDAHDALGRGWSVSWPMDEGLLPPPFIRIDHALFDAGLTPTAIRDVPLAGSDHKGFVVTVGLTDAAFSAGA